ncbi:stage II sporulation protein D [Clostridium sp. WILCCON 0269]|uniref:Stage II sporulation protein D n=1 Tax=Candidatus Clostridium eludens TaxID=3381663 RepID=A0ABW8SL48_9CLOT
MKKYIMNFIKKLVILIFMSTAFIILLSLFITGMQSGKYTLPEFIMKSKNESYNYIPQDIKVYITEKDKVEKIPLEEYVVGVVASEMPAEFSEEAIKAQAVAARTFGAAHMEVYGGKKYKSNTGADVCDTVACQVFMSKEDIMKKWPESKKDEYWNKIVNAVGATSGQVLSYENKLVMEPYYFAVSGGKTENAVDVFGKGEEYLKSVESPGEESARKYRTSIELSYAAFIDKVNSKYPDSGLSVKNLSNQIVVKSRNEGGSVKEIKLGAVTVSGVNFRTIMSLNSSDFNIYFRDNIIIECIGYGHRVGMSQWGANAMAKDGKGYKEILAHYYNKTGLQNVEAFYVR